jgi:RNA-binding protein YhbY
MSSICIVPLQQDYEIKDIKVQMFKLKCDGTSEKESFVVEQSDGTLIEVMFNTILLFKTMSNQRELTGSLMFSYFDKC